MVDSSQQQQYSQRRYSGEGAQPPPPQFAPSSSAFAAPAHQHQAAFQPAVGPSFSQGRATAVPEALTLPGGTVHPLPPATFTPYDPSAYSHAEPGSSAVTPFSTTSRSSAFSGLEPLRNRREAASSPRARDEEAGLISPGKRVPLALQSFPTRAKRKVTQLAKRARKEPIQIVAVLMTILLMVMIGRFIAHTYSDRAKSSHFTIVAMLRDMSPATQTTDKVSYAFQHTALASWSRLVVGSNIIVFADTEEQCGPIRGLVRDVQCYAIPCWHNEFKKPLLNCMFDVAHAKATTDIMVYVNGDVALYEDLAIAIENVAQQKDKFVMVGRRTNTLVSPVMLDDYLSPTFPDRLRLHAQRNGQLHSAYGIDVFVYRKRVLEELRITAGTNSEAQTPSSPTLVEGVHTGLRFPPFLAGVYRWDNWLLSQLILDESVSVIDMTAGVMFVHQEKGRANHQSRAGAAYNDALAKTLSGTHYKIGTIDNAGFVLAGPGAGLREPMIVNTNVTDVVLFTKKASANGYLVILTVNHNYINLALNWVCWADRIRFTNFILIAEDQSSATNFQKRGVAVIVRKDAPWIKKAGDYGSVEFQETMTFRTEFLMHVLTAGFHFVTADMDGLWLDDPLAYFNHAADLQGQMHKETKISGGLVVVRATTYGRYFWNLVIECQRGNALFLATAKPGTYVAATYTEQYCINELSRGLASHPLFSRSLLDPWLFPDGKSFFDERQSQLRGIWPAIIHNNWIVGTTNKIKRLHDWNLASAEDETQECTPLDVLPFPRLPFVERPKEPEAPVLKPGEPIPPRILGAPPKPVVNPPTIPWSASPPLPFDLKLRIFTSNNPVNLARCLASLAATDFEADGQRIGLEISIDHPPANPEEDDVRGWNEVHLLASAFSWNDGVSSSGGVGEKLIIEQPTAIGAAGQFLRGWSPSSSKDTELMLYIDDSAVLAPGWYKWLKRALLKYATHPDQFDPRLMGISLNMQSLVLGETFVHRYAGEDAAAGRTPYDLINKRSAYYKYQLFSAANTVTLLFPQHWRLFQTWLGANHVDTITALGSGGSTPCVPTMISNKWWTDNSKSAWYQWINRYVFEQGYFFLYTNFDDRDALAMPGALFQANERRSTARINPPRLLKDLTSVQLELPSSPLIPVYDFQFNHVSTPDVLSWRRHIVSERVVEQCWTLEQLAPKLRADEAAAAEAQRLKDEAKALAAAEKKAKLKAEKDAAKAEKDRLKKEKDAAAKAEKDAAAAAKKEAAKAKAVKDAAEKKKKEAAKSKAAPAAKPKSKPKPTPKPAEEEEPKAEPAASESEATTEPETAAEPEKAEEAEKVASE